MEPTENRNTGFEEVLDNSYILCSDKDKSMSNYRSNLSNLENKN